MKKKARNKSPPPPSEKPKEQVDPRMKLLEDQMAQMMAMMASMQGAMGKSATDATTAMKQGTGEAVSDPEEDKQAANPPHHDR